jgi:hypothetical protein
MLFIFKETLPLRRILVPFTSNGFEVNTEKGIRWRKPARGSPELVFPTSQLLYFSKTHFHDDFMKFITLKPVKL